MDSVWESWRFFLLRSLGREDYYLYHLSALRLLALPAVIIASGVLNMSK